MFKKKTKKIQPLCQPADARRGPISAGYGTGGATVKLSDAMADSEHAVGAWQVYLRWLMTGCGLN